MLKDKVCVVTGSGAGIGRATALEMAHRGARVVVSDTDDARGGETLALIEAEGGAAVVTHCDVAEEDQLAALMAFAVDAFGGIDVLHNNAGITEVVLEGPATIESLDPVIWDRVMAVNLRGAWLAIKHAAPHLRASERGPAIVNAASVGGATAYPGTPAYCISKAGMIQLTKQAAVDLAPTVRVNCYCPAAVQTGMIQALMDTVSSEEEVEGLRSMLIGSHLIPRLGAPEDVAQLVCFLASDQASFITGAAYEIDGGSLAWRGSN